MERARKDIHNFIDGGVAVSHALSTDKTLYEMLDREYESQLDFYETFDGAPESGNELHTG